MNRIKLEYGLINYEEFEKVDSKIEYAQRLIEQIDEIYAIPDETVKFQKLHELQLNIEKDSIATVCEKEEIKWPVLKSGFKFLNIIKTILFE